MLDSKNGETMSETLNEQNTKTQIPVLTFQLADQEYALSVSDVVQIIEMVTITSLPEMNSSIPGVLNYRGNIVPVINMRLRFGLPFLPYGLHTPIILVEFHEHMLGLIVDNVQSVMDIDADQIDTNRMMIMNTIHQQDTYSPAATYITSLAKVNRRIVPVITTDKLLSKQDHEQVMQQAESQEGVSS